MLARSFRFSWKTFLLVTIGAIATTAVIVGALLVGDSVRASMRSLILDRLGRIEYALLPNRFLDDSILQRMEKSNDYPQELDAPLPAILFPRATAECKHADQIQRSGSILVFGYHDWIWHSQTNPLRSIPSGNEVVLNEALASELGASVGDNVTLRLPSQQAVPADSPLGKKETEVINLPQLRVAAIIPNQGLGRFDLRASQKPPRNAFVPIGVLQDALNRRGQFNATLITRKTDATSSASLTVEKANAQWKSLAKSVQPKLADYGLKLERVKKEFAASAKDNTQVIYDYYHITSEQLLISDTVAAALQEALPDQDLQPVLTYLVNGIEKADAAPSETKKITIPYSTISAIDDGSTLRWHENREGKGDANIVSVGVTRWLAEQLKLQVGDRLSIAYYLPETVHGKEVEKSFEAQVASILPLTQPSSPYRRNREAKFSDPPTVFNDPHLTPEVPGITDQDSISDWDLPFRLTREIRSEDDDYWEQYRLTPKLYLSLADGQKLFGSRFGKISSIRIPITAASSVEDLEAKLLPSLEAVAPVMGLQPVALLRQQLDAAKGTTPFDALFLSLSFFVIIAALILVSLLFRLSIEQRASQWGLLFSLGWRLAQVRWLLLIEGGILAAIGGTLGILVGIGYAYAMILGLSGWWIGAIQIAFLRFTFTPWSLVLGWLLGWIAAIATIRWSLASLIKVPILRLLRERLEEPPSSQKRPSWHRLWLALCCLGAMGGVSASPFLAGEAKAGALLGGAMMLVLGGLFLFHARCKAGRPSTDANALVGVTGMALQSARRNPLRSTLSVGMIAFASFLVLSVSLFQAKPTSSSVGGFGYYAESSIPIASGLSNPDSWRNALGDKVSSLEGLQIYSLRLRQGDDASCNNLYQAQQPQVLGIGKSLAERDAELASVRKFGWAAKDRAQNTEEERSPFAMLDRPGDGSSTAPYPVILDLNTAMWSLHRGAKIGEIFSFEYDGKTIYFQTVALLQNTLLQGYLLLGEDHFTDAFPTLSGYQAFLIDDSRVPSPDGLPSLLETGWGDEGLDLTPTRSILQSLLAVQNTYLSAFQALGALGLLLGTFGLSVVQLRTIFERRSEIALLRALGWNQPRIRSLLMWESASLLMVGVGIGGGAALFAGVPAWLGGQPITDFVGPFVMLMIVIVTGFLSSLLAVRQASRIPLLDSLRGK